MTSISEWEDDVDEEIFEMMLEGAIGSSAEQAREILEDNEEWNTKEPTHISEFVRGFAIGVLQADLWHKNYMVPEEYGSVINWIAFNAQKYFGEGEVIADLSLLEIEDLLRNWAMEHPVFRLWGEGEMKYLGNEMEIPEDRDFIDLDAALRNAVIHIRDERRMWR